MDANIRIGKGRINPLLFDKSEADFIDTFNEISLANLGATKSELKALYKKYGKFKATKPATIKSKGRTKSDTI
jgi:hypothetical protein